MQEREVELLEGRVRRSLGSLDQIAVPGLEAVRTRRPPSHGRAMGVVGTFGATALVLVLALVVGAQINTWRGALSGPSAGPGQQGVAGRLAPDDRYGLLVAWPGDATTLVDEHGTEIVPPFFGVRQAKTSPNGRYVALWLTTPSGYDVRILDGVTRSLGPMLFATTEQYARSNEGLIWASDSSAVLIATTADPIANSAGDIRVTLRAIDLGGNVRVVGRYTAFTFVPLGWDRGKSTILARAAPDQNGTNRYLRFADDGSGRVVERSVADMPIASNDAGTFVASHPTCPGPGPCRSFTIHDAETYAVVGQIDLPPLGSPLTQPSANWAILFRPRSADVIVYFSRTGTTSRGVFGIELYENAGRGPRRDLGDVAVDAASGIVFSPNAFIRADGSATLYVHATDLKGGEWRGDLIAIPGGAHTPITTGGTPRAAVLLDPKL
jgi:hypothetical protein